MIRFFSAEALPAVHLGPTGPTTSAFIERGVSSFRDAARLIGELPYSHNSGRSDQPAVLRASQGTGSTKHGLLARLALEQNLPIALYIGIYEIDGLNTPRVGPVLETNGCSLIPEAHCYLKYGSQRIDVTSARTDARKQPSDRLLVELEISPEQTGVYEPLHRRFMRSWMKAASLPRVFTFEQLWGVREACMGALGPHA